MGGGAGRQAGAAWAVGWRRRRLGAVSRAAGTRQPGRDTGAGVGGGHGKEDGRTNGQARGSAETQDGRTDG